MSEPSGPRTDDAMKLANGYYVLRSQFVVEHAPKLMVGLLVSQNSVEAAGNAALAVKAADKLFDELKEYMEKFRPQ